MQFIETDIAIIGGGAAGLSAAIAAAEESPNVSIAVISKVYPVRSHTVCAEGGVAGVIRRDDTTEEHAQDLINGGDGLTDEKAARFLASRAGEEIIRLEHFGCPWSRDDEGKVAVRPFGGMKTARTCFAEDKTGFYLLHSLFERTFKHKNIHRFDEYFVTKLIKENGRIFGCTAFNLKKGTMFGFRAGAVILATGGAGRIYRTTTNSEICTGDGMALALRAGATLRDMEFVQFHPTALPRTGILITEAARGHGGYLINKNGARFMQNYDPERMELSTRDKVARAIATEIQEGRGFENEHVKLDIRHLGAKEIENKLPLVRELSMNYEGIDPSKEPIPVRPAAHYFMGGIETNLDAETSIKGLYAAGENASTGLHGANRIGGNSLAECLVFGRVAGANAAQYVKEYATNTRLPGRQEGINGLFEREENLLQEILNNDGPETVTTLTEGLQESNNENAGIMRSENSLQKGLDNIAEIQERIGRIKIKTASPIFSTELISYFELTFMVSISHAVLTGALNRKESRGSHFRTDFPFRRDETFKHHSIYRG